MYIFWSLWTVGFSTFIWEQSFAQPGARRLEGFRTCHYLSWIDTIKPSLLFSNFGCCNSIIFPKDLLSDCLTLLKQLSSSVCWKPFLSLLLTLSLIFSNVTLFPVKCFVSLFQKLLLCSHPIKHYIVNSNAVHTTITDTASHQSLHCKLQRRAYNNYRHCIPSTLHCKLQRRAYNNYRHYIPSNLTL